METQAQSGVLRLTQAMRMVLALPNDEGEFVRKSEFPKSVVEAIKRSATDGILTEAEDGLCRLTPKGSALLAELKAVRAGLKLEDLPAWAASHKSATPSPGANGWCVGLVKKAPWFTNSHFAAAGVPPTKEINTGKPINIERVIPPIADFGFEIGRPVGLYQTEKGIFALAFCDGTTIDREYVEFIERLHPGGSWLKLKDQEGPSTRPLVWVIGKTIYAIVMPLSPDFTPDVLKTILAELAIAPTAWNHETVKVGRRAPSKTASPKSAKPAARTVPATGMEHEARTLILEGKGPAEVARAIGCRRGFARRILTKELARLGSEYRSTLRIVNGQVVEKAAA